ncbi:MAG: DUF1292 domain-containing protein [Clostridia bacterium]
MADFFDDQNNSEEEDDIIILHNEIIDKDEEFYHLATLDVDKRWFIVMKPVEKLDDIADDEVLIYEIVEDENGGDDFAPVEDEALLQKVFDEFNRELQEYCDENDDECDCGCGKDECGCGSGDACVCGKDDCGCTDK